MNNERPPIRVFGQRSISSSFLSRSSNPFKSSNDDSQSKLAKKNSQLSLSDFLDRKLPETSVPQRTVKGKSTPFSSLQGPRNSNNAPIAIDCGTDSQTESAISKVLFEQFKRSEPSQCEYLVSGSASERDIFNTDDILESRKRKKSNEGFISTTPCESQTRKMNVVVIGGDPRPEQKGMQPIPIARNKKPKPLYNHYASGSGWWDSNMEGVDSEEVGLGEVWEGVGSTTLGGIEWH
ncbi:hypothetical protein IC582_012481 [Cucumis melo]|uniref:Uncharacterized protein n=2 Tax=Cucumis melo TaxID=3656 RepID=A0A5A7U046_CUCMM|nr:uncharacterized protein LOC103483493 [Cucumis melo]KAA0049162.1 uncharacterized protein E6C27_scaffold171G003970 [Cucumis melo var. makuwa]